MPTDATSGSTAYLREVCVRIVTALAAGETPTVAPEEISCFAAEALEGDPNVTPDSLGSVLAALTEADIPTLERAIQAIDANEQAWLGFKIVSDPDAALDSEDTDVVAYRGKGMGSADALSGLFVLIDTPTENREDSQLVFSRPVSERDHLQMFDITRGPQMHSEQYSGVAFKSVPLFRTGRVFIFGAGTVAMQVERVANMVDFKTIVVDYDPKYLNAERFPLSERILIDSFEAIPDLGITPDDYVCVIIRGHMYDPEALVYGIKSGAGYVGMMGVAEKNERVFELLEKAGYDRTVLQSTHTPIGLMFGAKSPAELAISVVAELIQVRRERRRAAQAQA